MTENEQIQEMHREIENWDDTQTNLTLAEWMYAKGYRKVERGEWIVDGLANPKCSRCRSYNPTKAKYCPECGADMRGEGEWLNGLPMFATDGNVRSVGSMPYGFIRVFRSQGASLHSRVTTAHTVEKLCGHFVRNASILARAIEKILYAEKGKTMIKEYHKIETLFERDTATKKLIIGKYRNPTVEFLKDAVWQFTEKVDGTNIRVHWDGHKVSFAGRTDRAQIPSHLLVRLEEMFGGEVNEQIFEQTFGEKEVTLYGEGYGHKIQTNGYIYHGVDFILFDVFVGDIVLARKDVEELAKTFHIKAVPIPFEGTIQDGIKYVKAHHKSFVADMFLDNMADMEGLVARPKVEVKDRLGNRVIVKIKYNDFKEE